ncbi:BMP family lipoprotein [Microbacterium amylolyticum]|uniref:Basic membrane protein A n=1 Tax=Microbacterium amylolyticum TaxID=936337 RepID=A0ABS4ZKJ7_9MICO|nr:BMP family ABC transporter substrate-binding protein [Microbacterium amylolyticum]MBP2437528.1 basic membrane protein A [Microbacterium amylolyticum]
MKTMKRAALSGLAVTSAAILLAACGTAPEAETPVDAGDGTEVEVPEGLDFLPCLISDEGGWNDRSFNQSAKTGMDRAGDDLGVTPTEMESTNSNDYGPNLSALVDEGCDLIVSVGFNLSAATVESALANPHLNYAIIDDWADNDFDGETDAPNIRPLVFDTVGAAFLGGYAAAAYSHEIGGSDSVGTFGGMQIPSVTVFMDGFALGVDKYNEEHDADVSVVGWNVETQEGLFTGGFEANDRARQTAEQVLSQGVDVILPVGGPIYTPAIAAMRDSYEGVVLLGVDSDLVLEEPDNADIILVSIMKAIDQATYDATVEAAQDGADFNTDAYIGTLENGGTGLSGFHDFESELPDGLLDELADLQEQLISGDLVVESENSP